MWAWGLEDDVSNSEQICVPHFTATSKEGNGGDGGGRDSSLFKTGI